MTVLFIALPFLTAGIGFLIAKKTAKTTRTIMQTFGTTTDRRLEEERTIRLNYFLITGGGFVGGLLVSLYHFFG